MYAKYLKPEKIRIIPAKKTDIGVKEFFNQLYPNFHLNKNKILIRCIPLNPSQKMNIKSKLFTKLDEAVNFAQEWDKKKSITFFFNAQSSNQRQQTANYQMYCSIHFYLVMWILLLKTKMVK